MTKKMKLIIIISLAVAGVLYFLYDYNKKQGSTEETGTAVNDTDAKAFAEIMAIMNATDAGAMNWIMDGYTKEKGSLSTIDAGALLADGSEFKTGNLMSILSRAYIGYDFSKVPEHSAKHQQMFNIYSNAKTKINSELGLY